MKGADFFSATALLCAGVANAHGYVTKSVINGQTYEGYNPFADPYYPTPPQRIFRRIPGNGPVEDLSLSDVQCNGYQNSGSAPAPLTASAPAGSTLTLNWTQWPDSHKGPIFTYMAKCPGDCKDFSPGTSKVWFKVHQAGKNSNGTWASTPLESNQPYSFRIPSALATGNYVVRHELWALHSAYSYPGLQVYPSCFQVAVTGGGGKTPPSSSMVAFPGAYSGSTPGVVYDIYKNGPDVSYPMAGPSVWSG